MHQIGAVLEGTRNIHWALSAWDNLIYYGHLKGVSGRKLADRAEKLLREMELWDRRNDLVRVFSRGMQQKIAVACALVADPPIILLDEPTLGLDVQAARTVKSLVGRLSNEYGKTVVLTTHQLDMAQTICDRMVMYLLLNIRIPLRLEALPALLLTLIGVFGFGFIIAGVTLIFKQVESFSNLLNNALAFLNGSFLPVSAMPAWMAVIAKTLPSTQGIIVIREIVLDGKSLTTTWVEGSLVELTLHSAIYFLVDWSVFAVCERTAKNRGSLGQY